MATLNQYASRIAHIIGQPNNLSLTERCKDMIKDYFAKYIIQSIDRNGITQNYKTSLEIDVIPIESTAIINTIYDIWGHIEDGVWVRSQDDDTNENHIKHPKYKTYTEYKTITKIPVPMNIKNDAPFIKVGIVGTPKVFNYCSDVSYRISHHPSPTRSPRLYQYKDNYLYVRHINYITKALFDSDINRIEIVGIWQNPEEVIGYYSQTDNQDLELPFPNEMMQLIIQEILKTEFNIQPKDVEVKPE